MGKGDVIENNSAASKDLTDYLSEKLSFEVKQLKELVINKHFENFKVVFCGRESRNKSVDRISG
jgi:hypothetical protein